MFYPKTEKNSNRKTKNVDKFWHKKTKMLTILSLKTKNTDKALT